MQPETRCPTCDAPSSAAMGAEPVEVVARTLAREDGVLPDDEGWQAYEDTAREVVWALTAAGWGDVAALHAERDELLSAVVRSVQLYGTGFVWRRPDGQEVAIDPAEIQMWFSADEPPTMHDLRAHLAEVERERADLQATFALSFQAARLAIARWREATGSEHVWPDSANLMVWLMDRLVEVDAEREQAIAHDTQPYPTADAYEAACAALEKHRQRADAAEAERDQALDQLTAAIRTEAVIRRDERGKAAELLRRSAILSENTMPKGFPATERYGVEVGVEALRHAARRLEEIDAN